MKAASLDPRAFLSPWSQPSPCHQWQHAVSAALKDRHLQLAAGQLRARPLAARPSVRCTSVLPPQFFNYFSPVLI